MKIIEPAEKWNTIPYECSAIKANAVFCLIFCCEKEPQSQRGTGTAKLIVERLIHSIGIHRGSCLPQKVVWQRIDSQSIALVPNKYRQCHMGTNFASSESFVSNDDALQERPILQILDLAFTLRFSRWRWTTWIQNAEYDFRGEKTEPSTLTTFDSEYKYVIRLN